MTGATFVHCPGCDRLMLGQTHAGTTYPQPHACPTTHAQEDE